MVVNLESAFRFPLKDEKWIVKILIGGALFFIPVLGWFLIGGYVLKILNDAKNKKEPVLPEWTDWAGLFQDGFMVFIVGLCYSVVPYIILSVLGRIPIIGCLTIPLNFIVGFVLGPVIAIALCFYLERKELGAAFDFKAIIEKLKINIVDYLIIALVSGVLGSVAIITLIFAVFIWFYLYLVTFRLYGEVFSAQKTA